MKFAAHNVSKSRHRVKFAVHNVAMLQKVETP